MITSHSPQKPRYNLNLVVQETGVKPDTLRAWERRYNMPQPARTEGGHRLYSDHDIQAIKWLQSRLDEGMRISQAVEYWQDLVASGDNPFQLFDGEKLPASVPAESEPSGQALEGMQEMWIRQILKFNEAGAEQVLNQAFAQFPIETVSTNLIYPALAEIGSLWLEGSATVQQEHFASELIIRKLQALTAAAPRPLHSQKILLACPPDEFHAIPLLMLNLLLRYRGWDVIYLGANVPLNRLKETVLEAHPDLVVFSASRLPSAAALVKAVQLLKEYQIPSAYGGWIFSQVKDLPSRIPAHYLGANLHDSIVKIENLLANPSFSPIPTPEANTEAITEYLDQLNLLEHLALKKINRDSLRALHADDLLEANHHLSQDILAALTLNELDLIGTELFWVKGLLAQRELADLFSEYLTSYAAAAAEALSEKSRPVLDWLESAQKSLPEENVT